MNIWDRIKEDMLNQYNTTEKADEISDKIEAGKTVTITRPTSVRTYTRGPDNKHYIEGNIDIGDTTANYKNGQAITQKLASTSISEVKYDPKTQIASVTFSSSGKTYDYKVTPSEFEAFMNADSKGRHVATIWNKDPHFHI